VPGQFTSRPNRLVNEIFAAGVIYPAVLAGWLFLVLFASGVSAALYIAGFVFLVGVACMLAWDFRLVREAERQRKSREGAG
jgi:membrane protein implicated in regulation of membrane protease activity